MLDEMVQAKQGLVDKERRTPRCVDSTSFMEHALLKTIGFKE